MEFGGRHRHRLGALLQPLLPYVRPGHHLADLFIESIDDRLRRSDRCHQAEPGGVLVAGDARFGNRQYVGQGAGTIEPGDA